MASIDTLSGGNIEPRALEDEMRSAYLDYAMSVIVGRALPDVRDGLKPVHRRVLFSMSENGLTPTRPYRKCASIVGDVMGNYHPHGDSAIYDALARLAQPFSMRYELVDGQGNFGSIDDDPPAAMRYTEARLQRVAMEMLRDLDADTVDFTPELRRAQAGADGPAGALPEPARQRLVGDRRRDGDEHPAAQPARGHQRRRRVHREPGDARPPSSCTTCPGRTSRPAASSSAARASSTPTRPAAARSGCAGSAHTEDIGRGREAIIVTELPYAVKKGGDGGLVKKIAELVHEKKLTGIADLEDHSSERGGMRVVITLKRDEIPEVVLNQLYKHTPLQTTFGVNMVALVENVPRTLSLREVIKHYVQHQREVIVRRSQHELRMLERRVHVLEGLLIALDHLDAIIALIRASRDRESARGQLMERFGLTEIQASAILDLRLSQLTALEADAIKNEHADKVERIGELRAILGDEARVFAIIVEELQEIAERFGDERRTVIAESEDEIGIEDLIPEQQMVITITKSGYIKSLPLTTYRAQQRGGRGVTGMDMKDGDYIEHLFVCSSHDYLLFFSNRGKVYRSKVYELPEASRTAKGRALVNVLPLRERRAHPVGARDARLHRGPLRHLRDAQGHREEDRVPRLQHADQGRRDHRDQHPRRRRARQRAPHERRRRHPDRLAQGQGRALQRVRRAGDGSRHVGRARDGRRATPATPCSSWTSRATTRSCSSSPRTASASARRSRSTARPSAGRWASGRSSSPMPRARWPARSSCASTRSSSSSPRAGWSSAPRCAGSAATGASRRASSS